MSSMRARLASMIVPLLLAACYWQAPIQSGTFSFILSEDPASRALDPAADTARLYLMADGFFIPFGPPAHPLYDEAAISPGAVYTSPPIPAGRGYTVMLSIGKKEPGTVFTPLDYGVRDGVAVSTGTSTRLSLDLSPVPYILTSLWGVRVTGTMDINGALYASTEHDLLAAQYNWSTGTIDPFALLASLPTRLIASLSIGAEWIPPGASAGYFSPTPWLDTDMGIVPFKLQAGALDTAFAGGAGARSVARSSGLVDPGKPSVQVPVYIRSSGFGGAIAPSGSPALWVDADLGELPGGSAVTDLISTTGFAYMAAGSGALRIPASAVASGMTPQSLVAASAPFGKNLPGAPVLSLAAAPDGGGATILYMGTSNGAYAAVLDELSPQVIGAPWGPLAGTGGKRIRAIRAYEYRDYTAGHDGSFTLLALRTDTDILILEVDNSSRASRSITVLTVPSELPADVPEELNDFAWFDANFSQIYLVIAGGNGLVLYPAGTYNPG
jgi:hypothetical protein